MPRLQSLSTGQLNDAKQQTLTWALNILQFDIFKEC